MSEWQNCQVATSSNAGVQASTCRRAGARLADEIRRAQLGDERAFEVLYESNKKRVYWLCLRMTHNAADAEDLTQEAFLQAYRKLHTFRGDSSFSTWLHRVAINTVLMRRRKHTLAEISLEESNKAGDQQANDWPIGAEDVSLSRSVDRMTLERAIDELPSGYRAVFILHDVYGYGHEEIARLLGCSSGNCKSQLHKGRLRLRALLMGVDNVKRHNPLARRIQTGQRQVRRKVHSKAQFA